MRLPPFLIIAVIAVGTVTGIGGDSLIEPGIAAEAPQLAALPRLDLAGMQLYNWNAKWHASDWANGMSPLPWKFDRVRRGAHGDVALLLDSGGAPELMAQNGIPARSQGLWESDVTLPTLREGLIVAPLWLYDKATGDEIDFELAGRRGLDVTLHTKVGGALQSDQKRLFAGQDMSGQRHRFGIKVDEQAGYVEMYLDGVRVQRWDHAATAIFPTHPLKPLIEMWAADPNNPGFVNWVGRWNGIAPQDRLVMSVHGYRYTPLS